MVSISCMCRHLAVAALLATFFPLSLAHAVVLEFDPADQTVGVGQAVSVDVVISGLDSDEIVSAYDFDVLYDPAIVSDAAVEFGPLLGDPDFLSLTAAQFSPGRIDFSQLSLLSDADVAALQAGATRITLATLSFRAAAAGVSALTFDAGTLPGLFVTGRDAQRLDVGVEDAIAGQLVVEAGPTVVAEPSLPGVLVLAAIGVLLGRQRARSRHIQP